MSKIYKTNIRVYYEDTDSGGVVYYANYLKFAERARTELLREHGINQNKLAQDENILFVVRKADLEIIRPAKLDDLLEVQTQILGTKGATVEMQQNIFFENTKLCTIKIQLAVINDRFKPIRLPEFLKNIF